MTNSAQNKLPLVLPQPPILASNGANWKHIQFAHFQQSPCQVPEHVLPFHVICMNAGKPVRLEQAVDGQKETVDSVLGDLSIYPAYATQAFRWDTETEFFNLFLEPAFLAQVGYEVFGNDHIELIPYLAALFDPFLQQMAFALKASLEIDGENSSLYADSMAQALVVHLLCRYSSCSRQIKPVTGGFTQQQWRQVSSFIDANLDKNISLAELAAIVQLSPYHFAHLFKKSTNTSPHQYLIYCRIERAKQLMLMGDLSLATIAQTVGFASQGHFTYHFKRLMGITPKIFHSQSQER